MIRLKQLIEQAGVNPVDKKTSKDTFKNIEKTAKWQPIVGQFSKQFKSIITRPEQLISITSDSGKNLLSGFKQKSGTLQNGGTMIEYLKTPKVFRDKKTAKDDVPSFKLILQPNYASKYNPNHFAIDGYIIMKGSGNELQQDIDVSISKASSLKLPFYIGLYKNKSGQLTYAVAPGKSSIERAYRSSSDYTLSATTPQLQRAGNLSSVDELVRKLEIMLYDAMDRNKVLSVILPMTSDWNPPQHGLFS